MSQSEIEIPGQEIRTSSIARIRLNWLAHTIIAFVFSASLLAWIQFAGPNIVDYDGYYHIKTARLMRDQGVPLRFPWLKLTVIDEPRYSDPHMLMHVLQIPFTFLSDLRLAAKLAPVFFAAITFTIFYLLLRHYEIRFPVVWLVLLFASSSPFLYRMSMARGQSVSLAFQLVAFHLILKRSSRGMAILALLFVWTYNAFPTVIPLVVFGIIAHYAVERKIEYKLAIATGAGIIVGHIVNPYFPKNILFIHDHMVPKLFATDYATSVGSEWYPYDSWGLLTMSAVAIVAYAGGIILTNRDEWFSDKPRLFWFLTATMYFVLLMKSRRFVEYFPPSAIMFFAFSARQWLRQIDLGKLFKSEARIAAVICGALIVWFAVFSTVTAAREDVRSEQSSRAYRGGAEWLANNTPEGATVFHTDWDDFPMLFFYNTHNTYIIGLDPDFMRLRDAELFRKYEDITLGRVESPEDMIVKDFGCEYVFTDNDHVDFIRIADLSNRMKKTYSDRFTTVYQILEEPAPHHTSPK